MNTINVISQGIINLYKTSTSIINMLKLTKIEISLNLIL